MKRILIPFIASFGLSLGGATGIAVMRAPKPVPAKQVAVAHPPKDSTVADSAKPATDSTTKPVAMTDSASKPLTVASAPAAPAGTSQPEKGALQPAGVAANTKTPPQAGATAASNGAAAPGASKSVPVAAAPPKAATDTLVTKRLARVFAAMDAKDASRVLQQMEDEDVRAILASLPNKQQAAILGNFPTPRAAALVRVSLRTTTTGTDE